MKQRCSPIRGRMTSVMSRSMSNVTQLALQAGSRDRSWDSLRLRIRLFQKKLSEFEPSGQRRDCLSSEVAEISTFVAEIFTGLRALACRLDAVDNVISTLGHAETQDTLRKLADLNREELVEVISFLSLEFEGFLVRSEPFHPLGD